MKQLLASVLLAFLFHIDDDHLKMLEDSGGWEYIKMSDSGLQTEHVCFDGKPHPESCTGHLTLTSDKKFSQVVSIHGEDVRRSGTWDLDNDQLSFFDEFGTRDGPYTIEIDLEKKSLKMHTTSVQVELVLEKALHENKRSGEKGDK